MATEQNFQVFRSPGGINKSIYGGSVASIAGTQTAPQAYITVITGTEAIVDLTVPYDGFEGEIILIPMAAFTWTAAGNIAVLGTAVANRAISFFYVRSTGKWYPSYV